MIDPLQLQLTELYEAALKDPTSSRGVPFRIVDAMLQRIIELERSRNEIHKMAEGYIKGGMTMMCWVNVYADGTVTAYTSENSARQAADYFTNAPRPTRIAVPMQEVSCTERVIHTNEAGDTAKHSMHKEAKPDVATAIRRAAELSVDHILAWHGQGTSSSMAKSMTEEIERNMIAALKEGK